MDIKKIVWGEYEQRPIYLFTINNGTLTVSITNYGCTITSIIFPDKYGVKKNIVLGYDSLSDYLHDAYYTGCIIGRVANRISGGKLPVNNNTCLLPLNEPSRGNHLHGGFDGFNRKVFTMINEACDERSASLTFAYTSKDGEEGYPGNLEVMITYELSASNELTIKYHAITDQPTHVNLTNHTYFNLSGTPVAATGHHMLIAADKYLVTDSNYIPTGESRTVDNSLYDFRSKRVIDKYNDDLLPEGYNTYFIFNREGGTFDAVLSDISSGISVGVKTSFPGMLFYSGGFLSEPFTRNQSVCLETQLFPDAPNRPEFPATLLKEGDEFSHYATFTFKQ